ncbi:amino acid adenylation domain-containing protein [Candidatus Saccharibacteria bacterium]|nr:amino acid adenylation domain-containing protein [Candidatus Saccharibacteria bacterium]
MKTTVDSLYRFVDDYARQSPISPAVTDESVSYSYAELSLLSNYFAHQIQNTGMIPGEHIGLLYDRSAQSIVLMLSIMKAGGVYIPLNRDMPTERLSAMLHSADITTVIAPDHPALLINNEVTTLGVIDPTSLDSTYSERPNDVAYAIFTSGSTGTPKLALLTHSAVSHVMIALTERYYIEHSDRVLQFANLSFDGSISEIFGAFIAGAELVIPNEEVALSIGKLSEYMYSKAVTVAVLPPSLLTHLPLDYTKLKTVVVAGEPCPSSLARRITKIVPHFINAYGPTECAICVSTYEVPKDFDEDNTPIGEPLPGIVIDIIGDTDAIVTNGSTGELYVGGPSLFSGYYNNSEKTAGALIRNLAGELRYKTGDYVYKKANTLVYVSRADDYLKINGIRISPLEIEEVIQRFDHKIKEVAVIATENQDDKRLIAFYASDQQFTSGAITAFAKDHLPAYAIPHQFIHLPKLPLTSNQKIDKHALLAQISTEEIIDAATFMQSAWQSILHTKIDRTTHFFFAGGDSLKAMRLIAKVEQKLGIDLNFSDLFHHPIFDDFSSYVDSKSSSTTTETYNPAILTAYETMIWSASAHAGNPAAYTLTEVLTPDFEVDTSRLKRAALSLSKVFTAPSHQYILGTKGLQKQKSDTGIEYIARGAITQMDFDTLTTALANTGIDLANDPLITLHFCVVDEHPYIIIHAHHIVLSASMLCPFIEALWQQYNDTSTAEREQAPKHFTDNDSIFWQQAYDTHTDYVQLPWIGIRPPKPKNNGQTYTTTLSVSINDFVAKLGITKFVFYRSIFALMLHKISGQNRFYIGSSVDMRSSDLLGAQPALLNTLPLISLFEDTGETFAKFAQQAQQTIRTALEHRFMPLHDIIKLHPFEQDRLIGPFNVLFDYIDKPRSHIIPGLGALQNTQIFNATAKYDITLTVEESDDTKLYWEYDSELLDEQTVHQFAEIFAHLCDVVLKDADAPIERIPLLSDANEQTMRAIGQGDIHARSEASFYQRFVNTAADTPDAIAVIQNSNNTSYRDLQYLVDHYSITLAEQALPYESPVGVFMDRSVEMVAIIIALWRLGYAYVPIETSLPVHRIEAMVTATRMPLIITKSSLRSKLPQHFDIHIIDEKYLPNTSKISKIKISQSTLAYIIFTSGSTGTPKGVMIEHAGMINHTDGMIEYFKLDNSSTIAQTASHSFDISVWQLTTVLLVGGTIAIYSKDEQADINTFTLQLQRDKVTILEFVPSYTTVLLEHIEDTHSQQRLAGIAALISTGENISWRIIESWFRVTPNGLLVNAYGPAEASDDTNLFTFQNDQKSDRRGLPVGSPLANINVYVLNETLHPQPIGIQGEIYIAGIAVGRGYINDLDRTKQSFITHPRTGERMYKTGDIGYWSSDNQLMYTGRSDFQIKIRGFRVELEEIESHIGRYPNITSVAVVVAERNNSKQLHAYVTANIQIDPDTVLAYLRNQLPDYMLPSTIIQMSALPLNNSGKVDRHLLANKERLRFKEIATIALTESEVIVVTVWRDVFNLDHVTIDDDYYVLGGDSITSFRVYAKLNSMGYGVILQDILANPILKDFAKTIHKKYTPAQNAPLLDTPFSLTPIQSRLLSKGNPREVMSQNVFVNGSWDTTRLNQAVQTAVKNQGVFSLSFNQTNQKFEDSYKVEGTYTFTQSSIDEDAAFQHLNEQLQEGALFAYGARGSSRETTTLFISANHLVIDVISWSILLSAIRDAYDNTEVAQTDYSYGSWAQALQQFENPSTKTIQYWRTILEKTMPATQLLEQHFRREAPKVRLYNNHVSLSETTITEVSAYTAVLQAITQIFNLNQPGILVETHGRYGDVLGVNISQTIGWFTHLLPITGTTPSEIENIIRTDDKTKLSYGIAAQRQLLNQADEPTIIVNYLGKLTANEFSMVHNRHEVPISTELMECIIYYNDTAIHVELVLYATPVDESLLQKLMTHIMTSLTTQRTSLDNDRMQAILRRIGGSHG